MENKIIYDSFINEQSKPCLRHVKSSYNFLINRRCGNMRCVEPSHIYQSTKKQFIKDYINGFLLNINFYNFNREYHQLGALGLSVDNVKEIRHLNSEGVKTGILASQFNVSSNTIRAIVNRKTWSHIL